MLAAALIMTGGVTAQTLPFHLPEGAGTFRLGIVSGDESKWLDECKIKGKGQDFTITDNLFEGGQLALAIRQLSNTQGFIVELSGINIPQEAQICWAFGACDETMTESPKSNAIIPESCADNIFSDEGNSFLVYYGKMMALKVVLGVTPFGSVIRLSDAHNQESPLSLWKSGKKTDSPMISALCPWNKDEKVYFCLYLPGKDADYNYYMLPELFKQQDK